MTVIVPPLDRCNIGLFTDLYELTMLQACFAAGHNEEATFSLFVRRRPVERNCLLARGLDDVLRYLETLSFSDEAIGFLRTPGRFTAIREHAKAALDRLPARLRAPAPVEPPCPVPVSETLSRYHEEARQRVVAPQSTNGGSS